VSTLESFLATIDPSRTYQETEQRASTAVNSFSYANGYIASHHDFESLINRFYWHCDSHILGISHVSNPDPSFTLGLALGVLRELYGQNGEVVAFEMAQSGVEGGLYRLLTDIASQRARHYNSNEISARVNAYMNALSTDERFQVASEYVQRYGHLLPAELTEGSGPSLVAMKLEQIVVNHPKALNHMRGIGQG